MNFKYIFLFILVSIFFLAGCTKDSGDIYRYDDLSRPSPVDSKLQDTKCGIENCHGMDIICGENVPDFCTQNYEIGDKCRQYARCQTIDDACTLVDNQLFDNCKSCVENCKIRTNDSLELFDCESKC